jgi:Mn-dependent DtxR family transcriptional regulator
MNYDVRVLGAMLRLARYRKPADGEAIALRVGGTASLARAAMRRLERAGLVEVRRGRSARLTMAGLASALALVPSPAPKAQRAAWASRAA